MAQSELAKRVAASIWEPSARPWNAGEGRNPLPLGSIWCASLEPLQLSQGTQNLFAVFGAAFPNANLRETGLRSAGGPGRARRREAATVAHFSANDTWFTETEGGDGPVVCPRGGGGKVRRSSRRTIAICAFAAAAGGSQREPETDVSHRFQGLLVRMIVGQCPQKPTEITFKNGVRPGPMHPLTVDEPDSPVAASVALRENVPRRDAPPGPAFVVDLGQGSRHLLENQAPIFKRQPQPTSVQDHVRQ